MQSEWRPLDRRATGRRAWIIGGLLLSLLPDLGLAGEAAFHLVPPLFPALRLELAGGIDLSTIGPSGSDEEPTSGGSSEVKPVAPRPPLFDKWTTVVFLGGSFIATPIAGYLQWWKRSDSEPWHFA